MVCSVAGLFAGLFGIGGGIGKSTLNRIFFSFRKKFNQWVVVKGPLMLELGVLPEVASSTSSFMILFTSASALCVYVAFGQLVYGYAGYVFLMGFVCTLFGQAVLTHVVAQSRRTSFIVLVICVVIGFSTVLMGYQSIETTIMNWNQPFHFHLC